MICGCVSNCACAAESFGAEECSHIFGESAYQDATCSRCGKENEVYVEDDSDTTICSCGNRMNGYTGMGIDSNHTMRGKSVCERCGVYDAESFAAERESYPPCRVCGTHEFEVCCGEKGDKSGRWNICRNCCEFPAQEHDLHNRIWYAESFSAEQGNEIVGFCENKEGFCFTNERTYVCDKCNHCYVGCEDRDGDTPDEGCKCLYAESFSAHPLNPTRPSDDYGEHGRPRRPIRRPTRRPFDAEIMGYDIDNKTIGLVALIGVIGGWWMRK